MTGRPNFSWITDTLAVGGRIEPVQVEALAREHGIGAVVDLRGEDCDDEQLLRSHGIDWLHLPTEDLCAVGPAHLSHGVDFADRHLDDGRRVLIHCEHGIGRSAMLALCVMVHRGWAPMDALASMKDRRALVSPSERQFDGWCAWLAAHRTGRSLAWELPSYDAFGRVAYRHLAQAG